MNLPRVPPGTRVALLGALVLLPLPALANDSLGALARLVGAALLALQALTALGLGALGVRWALRGESAVGRVLAALGILLLAIAAFAAGRVLGTRRGFRNTLLVVCALEVLVVLALLASLALRPSG